MKTPTCLGCGCERKDASSPGGYYFCGLVCAAKYAERCAQEYEWCEKHGWFNGQGCGLCMVDRLRQKSVM